MKAPVARAGIHQIEGGVVKPYDEGRSQAITDSQVTRRRDPGH
jgi:hypothetical protein